MTNARTSQALLVSELERAIERCAPADLVAALDWLRTADRTRDVDDWALAYANAEHALAAHAADEAAVLAEAAAQGALEDVPAACVGAADDEERERNLYDLDMPEWETSWPEWMVRT